MYADAELLELTASEPLSLEEEYSMQISWREDPKSEFLHFTLKYALLSSRMYFHCTCENT